MGLIRDIHSREGGQYDLDSRCFQCRRIAYTCCYRGEWTLSGFICGTCIDWMNGAFNVRPGRLRTQITIEQLAAGSPQQTASGQPDTSWTTYATVMAEIQPTLGREFFAAQATLSEVNTKIRVRYMAGVTDGITAAMRINAGGVIYTIKAAINVENLDREWLLMCATGVNQG